MRDTGGVTASIIDVASNIGYPLVFALIAVESMGVPLPGETALITAAIVASKGRLDIAVVILLAAGAAIVGDNVGYLIGRQAGRRLLQRPGRFQRHRLKVIEYGQPFFDRHGPKAVFLGRWISGLRITAAWLAGVNRMRWPSFLFWNATGGVAWATTIGLLAYFLGKGAEHAIKTAGAVGGIAAVVAGIAALLVVRSRHRRRRDVEGDSGALVAEVLDAADASDAETAAKAAKR